MDMDALWRKVVDIKYGSMRGDWCSKEVGGNLWSGSVEMYYYGVGWFCTSCVI